MIFFCAIYLGMAIMVFAFCWAFADDGDIMTPMILAAFWPVVMFVVFVAVIVFVLFRIGANFAGLIRRKHEQ